MNVHIGGLFPNQHGVLALQLFPEEYFWGKKTKQNKKQQQYSTKKHRHLAY